MGCNPCRASSKAFSRRPVQQLAAVDLNAAAIVQLKDQGLALPGHRGEERVLVAPLVDDQSERKPR
jgi:hypothetical protein